MDREPSTHVQRAAEWALGSLGTDALCGARPYCFGHLFDLCNAPSPDWWTLRGSGGTEAPGHTARVCCRRSGPFHPAQPPGRRERD